MEHSILQHIQVQLIVAQVQQVCHKRFIVVSILEYRQLGYEVLTFDYRGIGKSAPRHLKRLSNVLSGLGKA